MASTATQLPPGSNEDRATPLITTYWVQAAIAIVLIALRFYSRRLVNGVGADDWFMLVGLVFIVCLAGFVTKYALLGGTKHLYALSPGEIEPILKWSYILQFWGLMGYSPTKTSVALLITRIMKPFRGWRLWSIVILIALLWIVNIITAISTYVQCNPASALWDKSITNAKCWNPASQADLGLFQASYNVFVDVYLALLPVSFIWALQTSLTRRLVLCILLSLGLSAAVCGSVKATKLSSLTARSDLTWEMYYLVILAGTENWIVLVCGSIPPLVPLYEHWKKPIMSSLTSMRLLGSSASRSGDKSTPLASDSERGLEKSKHGAKVIEQEGGISDTNLSYMQERHSAV